MENIPKISAELYNHIFFVGVINGLHLVVGYHEVGSDLGVLFLTGESILRNGTCSTLHCQVAFYVCKYQGHFPFNDPINHNHQRGGATEPVQPA